MKKATNFHQAVAEFGAAVQAIAHPVDAVNANGAVIDDPWSKGRQLAFLFLGGLKGSGDSITFRLQGRLKGTATWETVKDPAGVNVTFTETFGDATPSIDADGAVLGSFLLERVGTDDSATEGKYDALRLQYDTNGAAAAPNDITVSVAYAIVDAFTHGQGQADALFSLFNKAKP